MTARDPVCSFRFTFDTVFGEHSITVDITVQERIVKAFMENVNGAFKLLPRLFLARERDH